MANPLSLCLSRGYARWVWNNGIIHLNARILPFQVCGTESPHLLHDNRKYSYILAISTLVTMFIPHLYTLAATTGTVLLAAVFYPSSEILRMAQMVSDGLRLSKNTDIVVEYYYWFFSFQCPRSTGISIRWNLVEVSSRINIKRKRKWEIFQS